MSRHIGSILQALAHEHLERQERNSENPQHSKEMESLANIIIGGLTTHLMDFEIPKFTQLEDRAYAIISGKSFSLLESALGRLLSLHRIGKEDDGDLACEAWATVLLKLVVSNSNAANSAGEHIPAPDPQWTALLERLIRFSGIANCRRLRSALAKAFDNTLKFHADLISVHLSSHATSQTIVDLSRLTVDSYPRPHVFKAFQQLLESKVPHLNQTFSDKYLRHDDDLREQVFVCLNLRIKNALPR